MGVFGLANLPGQRNGGTASVRCRPHLCSPYALFTLVGIAGEDDLEAPDLPTAGLSAEVQQNPPSIPHGFDQPPFGRSPSASARRARAERPKPPNPSPDASASLRCRLIAELEQFE